MSDERAPRVDLIAPVVWQAAVSAAYTGLSPGERRLAESALMTLHDRHVGLTPRLAASLARTLLARTADAYPAPWQAVNSRLRRALEELAGVDARAAADMSAGAFQLRLNLSFAYLTLHIALPLCRAAAQRIGRVCLFAEEGAGGALDGKGYEEYAGEMERTVAYLAGGDAAATPLPELFWQERALALAGMARVRPGQRHGRVKPVLNPPDLAVFLRLNPPLAPRRLTLRRPLIRLENPDVRTRRLPDAGSDGVRISRDPADLHRMMLSEWHYPDDMRLDRLVNEGFLASHRPPRRVRLRDALIVGLLPGDVAASPVGPFIRACWFEMLYPLTRLLRLGGLNRSELRWIEGDSAGRAFSQSMLLDELPPAAVAAEGPAVVAAPVLGRHAFRVGSGWLPGYLDDHALRPDAPDGPALPVGNGDALTQWVARAWRAQRDNPAWHRARPQRFDQTAARDQAAGLGQEDHGLLDVAGYAFVHVNLFAPADPAATTVTGERRALGPAEVAAARVAADIAALNRLRPVFGRGGGDRPPRLSMTRAPGSVGDVRGAPAWAYHDGRPDGADLLSPDEPVTARAVAAALIDNWLATIIRELTHA